ncbi:MAG: hypothetical protein ACI84R_001480 [Candidatus Azotimanducaceae bacterium]
MKQSLALLFALCFALPLSAQEMHRAIIPNLIAQDTSNSRISVTVEEGLTSSRRLRSGALRKARVTLHEGGEVSAANLRSLADLGDGLAAQRYVRLLLASDTLATASDLAYYSAIAVGTGRVWTLGTMVDAMRKLDPKTEPTLRVNRYIKTLYPHAWAGNTLALQAVVAFNGEGRLFGPLSDTTRDRILDEARKTGNGRVELGMAVGLLERTRATDLPDPVILDQARDLLQLAQASQHLAVSTSAQNLLRLMDLAQADEN